MPDLSTTYLGLQLKNPLVVSASPLSKKVDLAGRLEAAGASAIVLYSLFEEQITHESHQLDYFLSRGAETYAEALNYFPDIPQTAQADSLCRAHSGYSVVGSDQVRASGADGGCAA